MQIRRTIVKLPLSLRGPQAVVTEGNACGAISWKNPGNRTKYQEIATSGYALLAMTWKFSLGPSDDGAETATPGGVALRLAP